MNNRNNTQAQDNSAPFYPYEQPPNQPDSGQQFYADLQQKLAQKQNLTDEERLLLSHDYVQRYSNRLLNDVEREEYERIKLLASTTGGALAIMVPFNVAFMLLMQRDPTAYMKRCKTVTMWTALVSMIWVYGSKRQHENLDNLSQKYFKGMTDYELVHYHFI